MRKDNYPTRINVTPAFIDRMEPVAYHRPQDWFFDEYNFYTNNGYLKIEKFFRTNTIATCLSRSNPSTQNGLVTMEPGIDAVRSITGIHNREPFKSVAHAPLLLSTIRAILGGDAYMHQSRINYKAGLGANGWHWHSDFETWHAQDGMPGMRCVTAMVPLTENTNCNGSLMVIPGSHKFFYSAPKPERIYTAQENFADQKEGVPDEVALQEFFLKCGGKVEMITCEPGDLVLFDCNTIHVSTQNMTPHPRTNLFFVYNSVDNKLEKPFSVNEPRPEMMGAREITEVL